MAKYLDLTGLTHLWAKIKSYVGGTVSHDNLLDNWYWVGGGSQQGNGQFPINQRGGTSLSGATYVWDRWYQESSTAQASLSSDCITLTSTSTTNCFWSQYLDPRIEAGTYTISAWLRGTGGGYIAIYGSSYSYGSGTTYNNPGNDWTLYTNTITIPSGLDSPRFRIRVNAGTSIDIAAVKLEKGSVSTLSSDPIPSFAEQLLRCIANRSRPTDPYANKTIATTEDVESAVNALDGGTIGTPSAAKTVTALSQTNGNVSATFGNIAIAASQVTSGTLPVARGGTGAATFTSGRALIGDGTDAVTTRAITNNTATSSAVTGSTNLTTMNTLRYAINRTTSVAAADTNYTTVMARGIALRDTATYVSTNGVITLVYE